MLRAIAALLVVISHAKILSDLYWKRYDLQNLHTTVDDLHLLGKYGVDIFFVISGFIMAYIVDTKYKNYGYITIFLKKRILRIVPLYWICCSVLALLLYFFPSIFSRMSFNFKEIVLTYLFIPYTPSGSNGCPIYEVGWTLSYEMYFYLIVAISLVMDKKTSILSMGIFFILCTLMNTYSETPITKLLTSPFLLLFYAGFLLGHLYNSSYTASVSISYICIACGVIIPIYLLFFDFNALVCAFGAFVLTAGFVFLDKKNKPHIPKTFILLGDSSYSLYLTHYMAVPFLGKLFVKSNLVHFMSPLLFITTLTLVCCIIAVLSYFTLERTTARCLRPLFKV